jgi:hypothetical protein
MTGTALHRDNHYVPKVYLKRFASTPGKVFTYPILVSDARIPLWKELPVSRVAHRMHLYTRIAAGRETDEIERWMDSEFESPADDALRKGTSDAQMTTADWDGLVRFLAAQDVRTPVRLLEHLQRWQKTMPSLLEDTMHEAVRRLEEARRAGTPLPHYKPADADYLPVRVTKQIQPGQAFGTLKAEVVVGRSSWLFGVRRALSSTLKVLTQQRWSILKPHGDLTWFTSDDPVIRLNWYGKGNYDFKGGWGNPGTEILFPLGPHHLMYAKVGEKPPRRGEVMSRADTEGMRRMIAEHAHRTIIAAAPDPEAPILRPRTVDRDAVRGEAEQWRKWHAEQSAAEREMRGDDAN